MSELVPSKDQLYKMRAYSKLDQHQTAKMGHKGLKVYQHLALHYLSPIFDRIKREQANQAATHNGASL